MILVASVWPPPNVMTSSRETFHTAGGSEAPDASLAPRQKPLQYTVSSTSPTPLSVIPSLFPSLSDSFLFPLSLFLYSNLTRHLSRKILTVHLKSLVNTDMLLLF